MKTIFIIIICVSCVLSKVSFAQTFTVDDSAESDYILKGELYHYLKANADSLLGKNADVDDFYTKCEQNNYKMIDSIFAAISTTAGAALVAGFMPQNTIEENYKQVFNWMLEFKTDTLSSTDTAALFALANSCPYVQGDVVYPARTLYCLLQHEAIAFMDNCEETALRRKPRLKPVVKKNIAAQNTISVFPNPTNGVVNIKLENTNYSISVTDLLGREISFKELSNSNNLKQIKLNSTQGLYLILFTNLLTNEITVKKISLQY